VLAIALVVVVAIPPFGPVIGRPPEAMEGEDT